MSAPTPIVSVVTAAYNGETLIRETIDSVLAQTLRDFEMVIVDDGSRDDTVAVVQAVGDPRIRVLRAPRNGGPAIARTLAMTHATGRYVAALDQDDLCAPDRFARQVAFLEANPDIALVASTIETFGDGPVRADPYPDLVDPAAIDWALQIVNPLAWSSAMMRGDAARALDPFQRDERRYAEDFDLYRRIRAHGRIGRIATPLVRYRHHAAGVSKTGEAAMIRAAGLVLADGYGTLFDGDEQAAGLLMSRHAGAGHAPHDAATLAACGRVLARLLAAYGDRAPDFAAGSAVAHWWRIARTGLRAGTCTAAEIRAARPAFARDAAATAPRGFGRDRMVGTARRLAAAAHMLI